MKEETLIQAAIAAQANAVVPYSGFRVGAALLTKDGNIYSGCNIENSAFSPTVCGERTAVFSAAAQGERHFTALAVVGDGSDYCYPCGVCRQVLAEFCDEDFIILCVKTPDDYERHTLGELLPYAFRLKK